MKKRLVIIMLAGAFTLGMLTGCSTANEDSKQEVQEEASVAEEPGEADEDAEKEAEANENYENGRAYLYGINGQKKSLEDAYHSFEKALELGKTEANFYLGVLYDWEGYPERDYEKSRQYYEAAGENPLAYVALGFNYMYGQGVEESPEKGKEYFDHAIEMGCMDGYFGLAAMAEDEEDYATAADDYIKVAEEGTEPLFVVSAFDSLGYMYRDGLGVEQDGSKAIEWFQKEADAGNSSGLNAIGYMYDYGLDVKQDYTKAMEWYKKAAEAGSENSLNWLFEFANRYLYGDGLKQSYEKAIECFRIAGESGSTDACFILAQSYQYANMGLEQDYEKAVEWYKKGAQLGSQEAMFQLGALYRDGEGVEQNYDKAAKWFDRAAQLDGDYSDKAAKEAENCRSQMQE